MRSSQPPRVASWLLRHFGSSPNNDAVIGDLNERYRNGRPYLWYWRQTIATIVTSFFREISSHRLLAIRALLVGWIIKMICLSGYARIYGASATRLFSEGMEAGMFVALIAIIALMSTGWIIANTHRAHARPMVLLYIAVELAGALLTFVLRGLFGFYYWIFPLTQVLNAIFSHLGVFNFIAALLVAAGLTVTSILIGSHALRPASA
jgi:hypothetical protein